MHEPAMSPSCLLVAHNYHPAVGAAATRLQLLTERLAQDGAEVTVLTSSAEAELTGPHGERIMGTSRRWMPKSRLVRTAALAVRAAVTARHHDVVISDPPPYVALTSMIAAKLGKARGIFYYCDSWGSVATSRGSSAWQVAGRLFTGMEALTSRVADLTVASTPALAQRAGRVSSSVELVRNGTDLSVYTPDGPTWQGQPLPQHYFLYAGTMGLVHGAGVFVEAARQLWADGEDLGLVFVGSGAEVDVIREAAATSEGRIVLLDPVSPAEVAELYRGCVGALSSMRPVPGYEDAWPVKTLAAMSCGAIPVYVSGGELAAELDAADLGFVEPYDVAGARRAMEAALHMDPQRRQDMSERCRTHAQENFDQRKAADTVARAIAALGRRD